MLTFKAHFDGKVIVPDEPVQLPMNEELYIKIETVDPRRPAPPPLTPEQVEERRKQLQGLLGLGLKGGPLNPNPRFKSDNDLWKKDHEDKPEF